MTINVVPDGATAVAPCRPTPRRACGDHGAVVVEAAFVMPILLFLFMGLFDIGMAAFETTQASAAARDGARFAILRPADTQGATAAAMKRIVGSKAVVNGYPKVQCLEGATAVLLSACTADPADHHVELQVAWRWKPVTFVGDLLPVRDIKGSARMAVVGAPMAAVSTTSIPSPPPTTSTSAPGGGNGNGDGPGNGGGGNGNGSGGSSTTTTPAPTTTTTLPPCSVIYLRVNPEAPKLAGANSLQAPLVVSFSAVGERCGALSVTVTGGNQSTDPVTPTCTTTTSTDRRCEATIGTNALKWSNQSYTVVVRQGSGAGTEMLQTYSFSVVK